MEYWSDVAPPLVVMTFSATFHHSNIPPFPQQNTRSQVRLAKTGMLFFGHPSNHFADGESQHDGGQTKPVLQAQVAEGGQVLRVFEQLLRLEHVG